jgi:two-component system OmpR family response regulator
MLELLLLRSGRVISKEQFVEHLCGFDDDVTGNAIEVYVHRLRKKLEPGGVRIVTVRGLGYCLERSTETPAAANGAAGALRPH